MPAAYEAETPWWPCEGVFITSGGSFYRGLGVSVVGPAVNVLALQHRKTRHQQVGAKAVTAPALLAEPTAYPQTLNLVYRLPSTFGANSKKLGKLPVACPPSLPVKARTFSDAWPRMTQPIEVNTCPISCFSSFLVIRSGALFPRLSPLWWKGISRGSRCCRGQCRRHRQQRTLQIR